MKAVYLIQNLVDSTYLNNDDNYSYFEGNVYKARVFETRKIAEYYIQNNCPNVGERILTVVKVYGL